MKISWTIQFFCTDLTRQGCDWLARMKVETKEALIGWRVSKCHRGVFSTIASLTCLKASPPPHTPRAVATSCKHSCHYCIADVTSTSAKKRQIIAHRQGANEMTAMFRAVSRLAWSLARRHGGGMMFACAALILQAKQQQSKGGCRGLLGI